MRTLLLSFFLSMVFFSDVQAQVPGNLVVLTETTELLDEGGRELVAAVEFDHPQIPFIQAERVIKLSAYVKLENSFVSWHHDAASYGCVVKGVSSLLGQPNQVVAVIECPKKLLGPIQAGYEVVFNMLYLDQ